MVVVYSIALVIGVLALIVIILGGSLSENVGGGRHDRGERLGKRGKVVVGSIAGFGMGGMAAEFSPLDFSWQIALLIAVVAGVIAGVWVGYAVHQADNS